MSIIEIVVAVSRNGVIGLEGGLPWHIPSELKRFKQLTMGKPIIMGRRTWESLPRKPLPGRRNIVLTRQNNFEAEGAIVVGSKAAALAAMGDAPEVAIIGGGEVYEMFLPETSVIYLTQVDMDANGDTSFPPLVPGEWRETSHETVPAELSEGVPGYTLRRFERQGTC